MGVEIRRYILTSVVLLGTLIGHQATAQIAVFDDSASYEAAVGNLLVDVDFSAGTNALVAGTGFDQLVFFRSVSPGSSQVFWSAPAGGIQNASSPSGGLSAQFYGLSNAVALRFQATPTPPIVTLFDAVGAVIDSRSATASGYYGVVSPIAIERIDITGAASLTLQSLQANQEAVPQADTTRPQVVSLDFDPVVIDVTAAPQTVTVTVGVTDDLSGVSAAWVRFISPSQQQFTDFTFAFQVSGDSLNQTRVANVFIPRFAEAGDWVVNVFVRDAVSNDGTVPTDALATLGLPTTIEVVSDEDLTPPTLNSLDLAPLPVDVTGGDQFLTVTMELEDDVAGMDLTSNSAIIGVESPSGQVRQFIRETAMTLVSGTLLNGTWEGSLPIPQYSQAGDWIVQYVSIRDGAGNQAFYSTADLSTAGFITQFPVISGPEDLQPPQLLDFTFAPALINTTAGSESVPVSIRLSDDLSGVRQFTSSFYSRPFVQFRSPSGQQNRFDFLDLTSGTTTDGVWEGVIFLPQFSEQGTYTADISANDLVGNRLRLFGQDIQDLGLPADLIVIRPSGVVDGIIQPDDGGTVTDNVFGSSASVSFPPGAVDVPTEVAIDVFTTPPTNTIPVGFQTVGSLFVNIDLIPEPDFPLPPPGLTVTLPMSPPGTPGDTLVLFRINPQTGALEPVFNFDGTLLTGTVNPDGLSVTFTGIRFLSVVVGFIQAAPGDLNADECVDRDDYGIIMDAIRGPGEASILLDLNGDGEVNRADARTLVGLFTNVHGDPCDLPAQPFNPPTDPAQLRK